MPRPGWVDVAGGKLTTYRLIAEQVVDRVLRHLGRKAPACRTATEPLLSEEDVRGASGILPPEPSRELVRHYCQREWAVHLDDVLRRRTSWHYYHPHCGEIAAQAARWMAEVLGWDDAARDRELARYRGQPD
jgi:glycerol-3-phosphate dehydrogenase